MKPKSRMIFMTCVLAGSLLLLYYVVSLMAHLLGPASEGRKQSVYALTILTIMFMVLPILRKGHAVWMVRSGYEPNRFSPLWLAGPLALNLVLILGILYGRIPLTVAPVLAFIVCVGEMFAVVRHLSATKS